MSNSGGRKRLGSDASGEGVSVASGRRLLVDIVEGRVMGQLTARSVLSSSKQFGRMTCHIFMAPYKRFRLQVEHQRIVEGMRGFGCAIDVPKFVIRQVAPAFMIEGCRMRIVDILQVKNRATRQFGEKVPFRNAIAVEMSELR